MDDRSHKLDYWRFDPTSLTMDNPTSRVWPTRFLKGAELLLFSLCWDWSATTIDQRRSIDQSIDWFVIIFVFWIPDRIDSSSNKSNNSSGSISNNSRGISNGTKADCSSSSERTVAKRTVAKEQQRKRRYRSVRIVLWFQNEERAFWCRQNRYRYSYILHGCRKKKILIPKN